MRGVQRGARVGGVWRVVRGVGVDWGGRGVVAAEEAEEWGLGGLSSGEGGGLRVDGGAVDDGADVVVEGAEAGGGLGSG